MTPTKTRPITRERWRNTVAKMTKDISVMLAGVKDKAHDVLDTLDHLEKRVGFSREDVERLSSRVSLLSVAEWDLERLMFSYLLDSERET